MKLLFLRHLNSSDEDYLIQNLSDKYEIIIPDSYIEKELLNLISDVDVCLGNTISDELLHQSNKLKLFQNNGAGVNNLNLELFKQKNIIVGNSHTNGKYVAEYAIALMFSIIKKIHHHDRLMRSGRWFKPSGKDKDKYFFSDTLIGKKIGILGFGNVGRSIMEMLSGFDNKFFILSNNGNGMINNDKKNQIEKVDLISILSKSEILFIALPLTKKTNSMMGQKEFDLINKKTFLINVSRAEIVVKEYLYNALLFEKIKGAALDVWYSDIYVKGGKQYPCKEYPFHKLNNVLLSPYRAGYVQNMTPHLKGVVENLLLFADNGEVLEQVDYIDGY